MKILSFKEKLLFYSLLLLFVGSVISSGIVFYHSKTKPIPTYGGEYIEGIVGQPLYINPLLSPSNETDADLVQLVYSSLFKYDGTGKAVPDLVENYDLSEDKLTYTVHLRKNVRWHDNEMFSADDVIFTINLISNPAYKSPLRGSWQGIETNLIDDSTIEFKIKTPYVGFLNDLTFGILPKHLWESNTPENFSLSSLNLKPIGTGPYKYNAIQKDSNDNIISYKLVSNPEYFISRPYISKMTFNFYLDEESAVDALNRKEIMGISVVSSENVKNIKNQKTVTIHKAEIPRYFAIFFNQTKSVPLASDEVREALNYATDRKEIVEKVLNGEGKEAYSPFLSYMIGYSTDANEPSFDAEKANKILDEKGWKKEDDGIRKKDDVKLEINLVTTDWDELTKTAEILKAQWEKVGARINITPFTISDIQENYIRPREYEALLFGQVVGADPDPYYFWHSDNKKDPGLNLSLFGNNDSDKLIDEGREEFDAEKRAEKYIDFQKNVAKEIPAIFLYSPNYIYPINGRVQGTNIQTLISPSNRFSEASLWYIKTKRIKK
ncbi:MAG: peptide ABC transporter substrate-binding protein [Candidatus Moraniibacteriota bacterium]